MEKIELSDYIEGLRVELQKSIESAQRKDLRFNIDRIDLELAVGVESKASGQAGVSFKFYVCDLDAGGGADHTWTKTQKLTIGLLPMYQGVRRAMVSGEAAEHAEYRNAD